MKNQIRVFAPASVANVACGFDILGFAVEYPGDEVEIKLKDEPGVVISTIDGDNGKLPKAPDKNSVTVPILSFLKHYRIDQGMEIKLFKKTPAGSGLGSSAASSVAGVFAANILLGEPMKQEHLLPFALDGEKAACGIAHADNVAPALLGGFVLIRSYHPLDVVKIPTPDQLYCTIFHPDLEVRTSDARKILKKNIPLKDAIVQWGNIAGLITGLMKSDYELISRSMEDVIVEPIRSILIPGFDKVKKAVMETGALGCNISGSGPSIFSLSRSDEIAKEIGEVMAEQFKLDDVSGEFYYSKINNQGPKVITQDEDEIL
ncbi:homoserine kinase [candidate division KSB1 bacterium 4484_87]|nr:MAG: homoserine kinase [candidate division KSB1 bacterium 4484_87]